MLKAKYLGKPITTIDALASALDVEARTLLYISEHVASYYYLKEKRAKEDGSYRDIYAVREPLKNILKKLNIVIFHNTKFPTYIHSAKHLSDPHDHISNAETHIGTKDGFNFDISQFFPSISIEFVFDIWHRFFCMPRNTAWLIAKLCTCDRKLVQGAPTSSGIGNLIFWESEPDVVDNLQKAGFTYSRYVDDVTISSKSRVRNEHWQKVFGKIVNMVKAKNMRLNRKKTIRLSGKIKDARNHKSVTGVNIYEIATYSAQKRKNVRAAVKQCEKQFITEKQTEEYAHLWKSTWGRVSDLCRLHPSESEKLKRRLVDVKPVISSLSLTQQG